MSSCFNNRTHICNAGVHAYSGMRCRFVSLCLCLVLSKRPYMSERLYRNGTISTWLGMHPTTAAFPAYEFHQSWSGNRTFFYITGYAVYTLSISLSLFRDRVVSNTNEKYCNTSSNTVKKIVAILFAVLNMKSIAIRWRTDRQIER